MKVLTLDNFDESIPCPCLVLMPDLEAISIPQLFQEVHVRWQTSPRGNRRVLQSTRLAKRITGTKSAVIDTVMRSAGDAGERCELESCLLKHLGWTHLPLGHTRYPSGLSFGPEKQSRFFLCPWEVLFHTFLSDLGRFDVSISDQLLASR